MRPRSNVLNIAMLGTGQHRDKVKNILTSIIEAIHIDPQQSAYLIDGPGASPKKNSQHPMLGTFKLLSSYDPKTGEIGVQKLPKSAGEEGYLDRIIDKAKGNISGKGYKDAILEICVMAESMLRAGKTPLTLNLFGFSRGGDTILRAANVLYALYGEAVEVNIFAIDPVPGALRQDARKARIISSNVKDYTAILMQDERRIDFEAQNRSYLVVQDPNRTSVRHCFYRGYHSFATQFYSDPKKKEEIIQGAPKLLWEEMRLFAERHQVRFKNNHAPAYVIAGGKSGDRTYTTTSAEELTSSQRLAAYTNMAINEQEYLNATQSSKSGRQLVRVTDRKFLSRKHDYFLHGNSCFQDKEHMMLFKENYPAFFDYFFQRHLGHSTLTAVWKEIMELQANPELKKFFLERASLDIATFTPSTLPPPSGIYLDANQFYNPNNPLLRIWEGLVEAVGAVSVGYDHSFSSSTANNIQHKILEILISDKTEKDKISEISQQLTLDAKIHSGPFAYKLATIAGCLNQMENPLAQFIANELDNYINRFSIRNPFRKNELADKKKAILIAAKKCLIELNIKGFGNDSELISKVISAVLSTAGEIRSSLHHKKEGDFERLLRQLTLSISTYSPLKAAAHYHQQEDDAKSVINSTLNDYYQTIHGILSDSRNNKFQIYLNEYHRLEKIINNISSSHANPKEVDNALEACKYLEARLSMFEKVLWEGNSELYKVTDYHKQLQQWRGELEKIKAQVTTSTFKPSTILHFSQHSQVISAPPDKLKSEIHKALSHNELIDLTDSLSQTAQANSTEDFIQDKARINFTTIKTGISIFAKNTTVKSAQFMEKNVFKSEIYYNPKELSSLGTDGYIKWAMVEVDNFRHANPMQDKEMVISGKFPDKFIRFATAYCQILNLPYINNVNKYVPTKSDIQAIEKMMANENHSNIKKEIAELKLTLRKTPSDITAVPTKLVK